MSKGEDNPIKYAVISATSGTTAVVAAVAGQRIRLLGYTFTVGNATNVTFEETTSGTDLTGVMELAAKGGISVPATYIGVLETATVGYGLSIVTSETSNVMGHVAYQLFEEITD